MTAQGILEGQGSTGHVGLISEEPIHCELRPTLAHTKLQEPNKRVSLSGHRMSDLGLKVRKVVKGCSDTTERKAEA